MCVCVFPPSLTFSVSMFVFRRLMETHIFCVFVFAHNFEKKENKINSDFIKLAVEIYFIFIL